MQKGGKLPTESYKGVRDFYPEDQALLSYITGTMRAVVERYGYEEYHASVLEPAELYKGKGAENEEIINEQSYTFTDRGEREVTLRPEMTPTVARMVAARRRDMGFPLRLYSIPNVFRYERPQRGRLREHWQLNVDLFGPRTAHADAEVIMVAHAVMLAFGATQEDFTLEISSRGFLNSLVAELGLSEEKAKALRSHLDRRAKMPESEFEMGLEALGVPSERLSPDQIPNDVLQVLNILREAGISNARFAPDIVRGFDYYTGIVFEVFDTHPENSRALFGGGRYDNLLALFDDEEVPAAGFGMGDVTVRDFLAVRDLLPPYHPATELYVAVTSTELVPYASALAQELREAGVNVALDFGEKKLGDQLRQASKHKIPFVTVIGDTEATTGMYIVRNLVSGEEQSLSRAELPAFFLTR